MSDAVLYGELNSEKQATDNTVARNIVLEINKFGVNDQQRLMIIYLLSLELENPEYMKELSATVKELGKKSVFVADEIET